MNPPMSVAVRPGIHPGPLASENSDAAFVRLCLKSSLNDRTLGLFIGSAIFFWQGLGGLCEVGYHQDKFRDGLWFHSCFGVATRQAESLHRDLRAADASLAGDKRLNGEEKHMYELSDL